MDNIFSLDACSGPMWNYICHLCANANRDFRSINLIDCVRSMLRQLLLRFVLVLLNASAISQNLINCIKIFSGNSKRGWRLESVLLRSSTFPPKLGLFSTANRLQARSDPINSLFCVLCSLCFWSSSFSGEKVRMVYILWYFPRAISGQSKGDYSHLDYNCKISRECWGATPFCFDSG